MVVLQTEHVGGLPFSIRYPCVNLVWPSQSRARITSQHLFLCKEVDQGVIQDFMLRSLLLLTLIHVWSALAFTFISILLYRSLYGKEMLDTCLSTIANFAALSALSLSFIPTWLGTQQNLTHFCLWCNSASNSCIAITKECSGLEDVIDFSAVCESEAITNEDPLWTSICLSDASIAINSAVNILASYGKRRLIIWLGKTAAKLTPIY